MTDKQYDRMERWGLAVYYAGMLFSAIVLLITALALYLGRI